MSTINKAASVGIAHPRRDGAMKVTGTAPYAYEHPVADAVHLFPLLSPVARGKVLHIDATAALALPGVLLVLTHDNAPRLWLKTDPELMLLQSSAIHYRGQFIGAVVAHSDNFTSNS